MADVAELNVKVRTQGVTQAGRELDRFGKTAKRTSTAVGGLVSGLAGLAAVRSSVRVMADFEETFAQVRGIIGATADASVDLGVTFERLGQQARDLGATTRFSATEAAEAQLFLARAGLTSNQILSELPATLDLAAAGTLGLGEAADIASNVLSTFGKQGLDLAKIGDTLVATANRTNTDVRQLGEAFKFVGASAAALEQDLDQVSAFIGVLGNSGIQASLAGTTLNATINALLKPTSAAKEEFAKLGEQLGLTAEDFIPSADRSLADIIETIGEAELSTARLAEVFGRTQATRGALIGIQNIELIKELEQRIKAARGEMATLSAIMNDTLAGAFRSLKSAVQEGILQIGEGGFGGALRGVVDSLTDAIRVLTGFEDKVSGNAEAARRLANVLKAVGAAIAALGFAKLLSIATPLIGLIKSLVGGFGALNAVMRANPIGLIVTAVAGLVFAYQELKDETVTVGNTTAKVSDFIMAAWSVVTDGVKGVIGIAVDLFNFISKYGPKVFNEFRKDVAEQWKRLNDFLGDDWKKVFEFIFDVAKTIVNKVIAVFVGLGKTIAAIVGRLVDVFTAFGDFDFSKPLASARKVRDNLAKVIDPASVIDEISDIWEEEWEKDYVGKAVDLAKRAGEKIKEGIIEPIAGIDLGDLLTDVGSALGFEERLAQATEKRIEAEKREAEASKARAEAKKAAKAAEEAVVETREKLAAQTAQVSEETVRAAQAINEYRAELQLQIELAGMSAEAGDRYVASLEIQAMAAQVAAKDSQEYNDTVKELLGLYDGVVEANKRASREARGLEAVLTEVFDEERLNRVGDALGDSFADATIDILNDVDSISDAFEGLGRSIIRIFQEAFIARPLAGALGGLLGGGDGLLGSIFGGASAKGNAFNGGRIVPLAKGGILDRPTFATNNGTTFLAGEAGPEAVMPLARDASGNLGVRTSGGQPQVIEDRRTYNVTLRLPNVRTPGDFSANRKQIAQNLREITGGLS